MLFAHHKIIHGVLVSLIALLPPAVSFADTQSAQFLSFGPGVVAAGMGDTFTASGSDMSVIYYNPSLLAQLDGEEISASHWFMYDGAQYNFVGFSSANENHAFAFAGTQLYRDNIEARQLIDDTPTNASNSQMAVYGAYAGYFQPLKLYYGANMKYLNYSLYTANGDGYSMDIGLSKRLASSGSESSRRVVINSGLLLQNVAQIPVTMISDSEYLPLTMRLGVSCTSTLFPRYNTTKDKLSYDDVTLESDVIYQQNTLNYTLGVQYKYLNSLVFRAGWEQGFTAGFGVLISAFQFDYALQMKDFTDFHRIGFSYRFGQKAETDGASSPACTDDFQKVYQQAQRIYERYCRDAAEAADQHKYTEAIELLYKAIPLRPKNNQYAKQLLHTCEQTLIADKTNDYIAQARKCFAAGEFVNAYQASLNALDVSASENVKALLANISGEKQQYDEYLKLISAYSEKISKEMDACLDANDFDAASLLFKKLEIIDPDSAAYANGTRKFKDRKDLAVSSFVSKGVHCMQTDDLPGAYRCFEEAENLSPADLSIRDQKDIAKNKFFAKRNYSLEENIYSDKLYYISAVNYATGEDPLSSYHELKGFNPVFENTVELESVFVRKGLITKQIP